MIFYDGKGTQKMRVVSGAAKGRKLREPKGMEIRPTTDMVKEALFNIIQFDIEGRRVLDLFAGTGQLGIEALSRGASEAVFVDESKSALAIVKDNLKTCGLNGRAVQSDSIEFLRRADKFDLIFLDPPYDTELLDKSLFAIYQFDILSEGGIIICESRRSKPVVAPESPYYLRKSYNYGQVKLTLIGREGN